ncbi:MAG: hypothetical protein Q7J28_05115 [Caulobacter sp.]|nr:hypothetical protein [Caulobacter sp.]
MRTLAKALFCIGLGCYAASMLTGLDWLLAVGWLFELLAALFYVLS